MMTNVKRQEASGQGLTVSGDFAALTIAEAGRLFRSGELTPSALAVGCLEQIEALNPRLNAFVTVAAERALQDAERATEELAAGLDRGPLHGIPISFKDNIDTAGIRTTSGTSYYAERVPELDATVARRLAEAGAVLLGKVNLHELALRVATDNPIFGQTRNPWDLTRNPGGSSGGSGAAVAAGLGLASVGSDSGGSIRIPASLCGVVGLKPTYGRVSKHGVTPMFPSYDCVGPLTRTVEDSALMLAAMAGYDPSDHGSVRMAVEEYAAGLRDGVEGLRVGVLRHQLFRLSTNDVQAAVESALDVLGQLGADVRDVEIAGIENIDHRALTSPEMAEIYAELVATEPQHFSPQVIAGFALPLRLSLAEHLRARRENDRLTEAVRRELETVDVLASPTTPMAATRIGQSTVSYAGVSVDVTWAMVRHTMPFNVTRLPAISVPCGLNGEGLPIGLQIVGRPFDEALVLRVAHAYERATEWYPRRPPGF